MGKEIPMESTIRQGYVCDSYIEEIVKK